jgi:hypothetical protein
MLMYNKHKFEGIIKCQAMPDTHFDAVSLDSSCISYIAGDEYVIKRQLIFTRFLMMLT